MLNEMKSFVDNLIDEMSREEGFEDTTAALERARDRTWRKVVQEVVPGVFSVTSHTEAERVLRHLAREVLAVQNACNLSGVVKDMSKAASALWKVSHFHQAEGIPDSGTAWVNTHPIMRMYADKVMDLAGVMSTGTEYAKVMEAVQSMAGEEA